MSLNTDIINTIQIEQYHTPVIVAVLVDNKYETDRISYKSLSDFIDYLSPAFDDGNYRFNGGNNKEFYITNDKKDITFQVSPFEFDNSGIELWAIFY